MNTLLETGLGAAERLLGSRFMLAVLLPVLLAVGATAAVALAATGRTPQDVLLAWQAYGAAAQLLAVVVAVLALVGTAYVLALFHLPLLRTLEGYWPEGGGVGALADRRCALQRRRATRAWRRVDALHAAQQPTRASALASRLLAAYPPRSRLANGCLPTALGNRMRAAEYYALERYGIDSVIIWPRLYPLLPPESAARISAARTGLDGPVSVLALASLFGTVWPSVLFVGGDHPALATLTLLGLPVAWIAYRAALQAASSYGTEICVAFDLHRHLLLRHLEIPVPADPAAERLLWDDLAQFYHRNVPLPAQLSPSSAPAATPARVQQDPVGTAPVTPGPSGPTASL
ncbi:hypothetical protein ABTY59_36085 [Streptomyces sp. NPDC096079]|uniref:hypothetical protein n=1 Tax=Streptomyces sp. NPDC096079 TaxID=3155820 RepID=UPI003322E3EA